MKRFITIFSAVALLSSFTLFISIDEVVNGLKNGDSAQIAKYFDNTVEITMPDKSNSYSKKRLKLY